MAYRFFDRVYITTPTTGTGDDIDMGSALSGAFFTLAEACTRQGIDPSSETVTTTIIVEQGNDIALYHVTLNSTATQVSIDSVVSSKISGTPGASRINLDGSTATIRFVASAVDLVADKIRLSSPVAGQTDVEAALAALESRRVGEFFWWPGDTPPSYALEWDGSAVSRTTYARLWAWVQSSGNLAASEGAKLDGEFGPGDGSTTFTLPDLVTNNRFIRAAGTVGAEQNDGAPNITGNLRIAGATGPMWDDVTAVVSGAFTKSASANWCPNIVNSPGRELGFDASVSNAKYGAASEIRPTNVAMLPCGVF